MSIMISNIFPHTTFPKFYTICERRIFPLHKESLAYLALYYTNQRCIRSFRSQCLEFLHRSVRLMRKSTNHSRAFSNVVKIICLPARRVLLILQNAMPIFSENIKFVLTCKFSHRTIWKCFSLL